MWNSGAIISIWGIGIWYKKKWYVLTWLIDWQLIGYRFTMEQDPDFSTVCGCRMYEAIVATESCRQEIDEFEYNAMFGVDASAQVQCTCT